MFSNSSEIESISDRLHRTPKILPKRIKSNNDAIVSDLPNDTLKWMKKRVRTKYLIIIKNNNLFRLDFAETF
jgi:late competence protein required for DNA uptake (superfamily II DNA/RNA helicase)